jgi:NAD(P)-dependent dehydrogenase (short-subunit alcohol dehydrogenase family)
MSSKPFAVIAGVGPGTAAFVARRFAKAYPVVLLARNPGNYEPLVEEIKGDGGEAIGISTDVSDEESVKSAFKTIAQTYDNAPCAAAIFNASGGFSRKPFLETQLSDMEAALSVTVYVSSTCIDEPGLTNPQKGCLHLFSGEPSAAPQACPRFIC